MLDEWDDHDGYWNQAPSREIRVLSHVIVSLEEDDLEYQ